MCSQASSPEVASRAKTVGSEVNSKEVQSKTPPVMPKTFPSATASVESMAPFRKSTAQKVPPARGPGAPASPRTVRPPRKSSQGSRVTGLGEGDGSPKAANCQATAEPVATATSRTPTALDTHVPSSASHSQSPQYLLKSSGVSTSSTEDRKTPYWEKENPRSRSSTSAASTVAHHALGVAGTGTSAHAHRPPPKSKRTATPCDASSVAPAGRGTQASRSAAIAMTVKR